MTTKNQIWTQAQRKIDTASRKYEKDRKEAREEASARILNENLVAIAESEGMVNLESIGGQSGMTAGDTKIALTAAIVKNNRTRSEGDPTIANRIRNQILDLRNPSAAPIEQRYAAVADEIYANSTALGKEAVPLHNFAKSVAGMPFSSPEINAAEEMIDLRLVGMSKSNNSYGNQNAANVANATDMKVEMYQAAREAGPGFSHYQWVQDNLPRYVLKKGQKAQQKAQTQRNQNYIVRGADGAPDVKATQEAIDAEVNSLKLTPTQADEIESQLIPEMQQEIEMMRQLRERQERRRNE